MPPPSDGNPNRFHTGPVLLVAGAHFLHDVFTAFLAPLLPLLIRKLGLSLLQAGSLSVLLQLPSLFNPLFGSLVDRGGFRRWLVIVAPGATGTAMCLMGLAPTYAVLAILMLAGGCSVAAIHLAGPVIVGRVAGNSVGRGMSFFMVGGELARTIGPLIAVQLVLSFDLEGMWRVVPVAVASSLVLAWRLGKLPERRPDQPPARLLTVWREMRAILIAVIALLSARSFLVVGLTAFLPTFLVEEGESLRMASISLALLELAGAAGALTSGTLSDHVGRRRVLLGALGLAPPLVLLFLWFGGPLRLIVLAALGFVILAINPVLLAVTIENAGANAAAANGTYWMIGFTVRSLVILAVGALGDALGLRLTYLLCAGIGALGIPFILLLPGGRGAVFRHDRC